MGFVEMFNIFARVAGVFISTLLIANHSGVCASYDYSECRVCDEELASIKYKSIPIRDFVNDLEQRQKQGKIQAVKASTGFITDKGFFQLMQVCSADVFLPDLKILDLSSNRITTQGLLCSADNMGRLLGRKGFDFLDIRYNPGASIDSMEFFSRLSSPDLLKIIWINKSHLSGTGWWNLLKGRHQGNAKLIRGEIDKITVNHHKYFQYFVKNKYDVPSFLEQQDSHEENPFLIASWTDFCSSIKSEDFAIQILIGSILEEDSSFDKLKLGQTLYQGLKELDREKAAQIFTTLGEDESVDKSVRAQAYSYLAAMHKEGDPFPVNMEEAEVYYGRSASLSTDSSELEQEHKD